MSDTQELWSKLAQGMLMDPVAIRVENGIALIDAYVASREAEAYERGYNNGYARQKYDADWDKVEANL